MKKRLFASILACVCLAGVVGCSSTTDTTDTSNDTTTDSTDTSTTANLELDMYFPVAVGGGPDALITALCEEYNAETDGVTINAIYSGTYDETKIKIQAATQAGQTPALAVSLANDVFTLLSQDSIIAFDD